MNRSVLSVPVTLALATFMTAPAFAEEPTPPDSAEPPALPAPERAEAPAAEPTEAPVEARATARVSPAAPALFEAESDHAPKPAPRGAVARLNVGLRVGYLPSAGFDTFANSDVLAQFSIDGTYPVYTRGRLILGAGLGWDVGGRSDRLRGFEASLTAHRFYVPLEARYRVLPSLYAFGKLAPGAALAVGSVKETSSPNELSGAGWAFSGDASVGASILIAPRRQIERREARFWLTPEVGWSYTTNAPLHLSPSRDSKDLLGADEDVGVRALALSGLFWRASLGATF